MPEFTPEQWESIRFCLDNWEKIKFFKEKGLFDKNISLAYIQDNFSPDGKSSIKHYHFTSERVVLRNPQPICLHKKQIFDIMSDTIK